MKKTHVIDGNNPYLAFIVQFIQNAITHIKRIVL